MPSEWEDVFLTGEGADWKGLDKVLAEIAARTPGVKLEHTDLMEGPKEAWMGLERKILPVERWLAIIKSDIAHAPDGRSRRLITGPHYFWGTDDLGRAFVAANHRGRGVVMFVEPWAGEPDV